MKSWRIGHFTLSDNDETRYSIPESAVPNSGDDLNMRLSMLGVKFN